MTTPFYVFLQVRDLRQPQIQGGRHLVVDCQGQEVEAGVRDRAIIATKYTVSKSH